MNDAILQFLVVAEYLSDKGRLAKSDMIWYSAGVLVGIPGLAFNNSKLEGA